MSPTEARVLLPVVMVAQRRGRGGERARIEPDGGCWLWRGAMDKSTPRLTYGRGGFCHPRRVIWMAIRGPLDSRDTPYPHCGRDRCVAPDHMVTHRRNSYGRGGHAKLYPDDVLRIRALVQDGATRAAMAHEYGLSWEHVHALINGTRWADGPWPANTNTGE